MKTQLVRIPAHCISVLENVLNTRSVPADWLVSAGLSCSSITSACSNNWKQHSTEFSREPCTQINSEMPKPTQGVNYARGGAGSEVSNRVYVIAVPVKKFGRVWLSTNFPSKQLWRRMQTWKDDEFLLCFKFSGVQTWRKGFFELF